MTNEEIYALFRAQDRYLKFTDFLENNIEFIYEEEPEEEWTQDLNLNTMEKEPHQ